MRRAWDDRTATMTEHVWFELYLEDDEVNENTTFTQSLYIRVGDPPQGSGLPSYVITEWEDHLTGNVTEISAFSSFEQGGVSFENYGGFAKITTWFGVELLYNTAVWYVEVKVPQCLSHETFGLCGNFNGECADEYTLFGSNATGTATDFGNSHLTHNFTETGGCLAAEPSVCAPDANITSFCEQIGDNSTVFGKCHALVNPDIIVDECKYDACRQPSIKCEIHQSYVNQCIDSILSQPNRKSYEYFLIDHSVIQPTLPNIIPRFLSIICSFIR